MAEMNPIKQFCSTKCSRQHASEQKYTGIEGVDYIVCPLCDLRTRQFTPDHARMHGYKSIQEMAMDNNISKITCDNKAALGLGEKNGAFSHGGKFSPWSKNFIHGYDEQKHQVKIKQHKSLLKNSPEKFKNNLAYWIKETNGNIEEAKKLHKKFQTRDMDWFVTKYGEEEGKKRYALKTKRWINTMHSKSDDEKLRINKLKAAGIGTKSKAELEVAESLAKVGIKIERQFLLKRTKDKWYYFDFNYGNKIIEYNGDYWHCNPALYESSYYNKRTKKTASEMWTRDLIKQQFAIDHGFEVMVIWECDYNKDKQKVIQECINFLTK